MRASYQDAVHRRKDVCKQMDSGMMCHGIARTISSRSRSRMGPACGGGESPCSPIWSRALNPQLVHLLHESAGYAAASVDVVAHVPAPIIACTLDGVPVPASVKCRQTGPSALAIHRQKITSGSGQEGPTPLPDCPSEVRVHQPDESRDADAQSRRVHGAVDAASVLLHLAPNQSSLYRREVV